MLTWSLVLAGPRRCSVHTEPNNQLWICPARDSGGQKSSEKDTCGTKTGSRGRSPRLTKSRPVWKNHVSISAGAQAPEVRPVSNTAKSYPHDGCSTGI
jgi:hypothetical protein